MSKCVFISQNPLFELNIPVAIFAITLISYFSSYLPSTAPTTSLSPYFLFLDFHFVALLATLVFFNATDEEGVEEPLAEEFLAGGVVDEGG